jgi:uncharacterized protein YeaO (DUF488 family)
MDVRLKRAYVPAESSDGHRVLIDRLWPRGLSRERAMLDGWEKELAPSAELRQWFGHDPTRFEEFRRRYIDELRGQRPRLSALRRRARTGTLTLVYAARDAERNDAVVLADILRRGLPKSRQTSPATDAAPTRPPHAPDRLAADRWDNEGGRLAAEALIRLAADDNSKEERR